MANAPSPTVLYDKTYLKSEACKDLEPIPGDFLIKKTEMDIISRFIDLRGSELGLEIGCGSGFQSALLSGFTENLIAADLPYYDAKTHSLGISAAGDMVRKLDINNVKIISCSGESLPFGNDQFDFVFSVSVLEHIKKKDAALKEMLRVLKPGGRIILCIPTYISSLYAFGHLFLYTLRRIVEVITIKILGKPVRQDRSLLPRSSDASRNSGDIFTSFRKNHPSFPIPEPHGDYKNIFQELHQQLPWNWLKLIKKCGGKPVNSFALLFLPFNILEVFSSRFIAWLYRRTKALHYIFGKSFLQYFCYSWCIVIAK